MNRLHKRISKLESLSRAGQPRFVILSDGQFKINGQIMQNYQRMCGDVLVEIRRTGTEFPAPEQAEEELTDCPGTPIKDLAILNEKPTAPVNLVSFNEIENIETIDDENQLVGLSSFNQSFNKDEQAHEILEQNKLTANLQQPVNIEDHSMEAKERQRESGRFDGKTSDGTPKLKVVQVTANLQQPENIEDHSMEAKERQRAAGRETGKLTKEDFGKNKLTANLQEASNIEDKKPSRWFRG